MNLDFIPYFSSLGTVINHEGNNYIIATTDGRIIGIAARGNPSQETVETDIANPTTPLQQVTSVRNAQLRQWLIDQNLDEVVEGKLASADTWPDIKTWKKAKARYEYEPNVNRTDALVIALGQDLGFTDEQLDAAFAEISLIP